MSNSLNNTAFQQFWARRMQMKNNKASVYPAIVSVEAQAELKQGDTYHKPYRSTVKAQAYTRGTAVTIQDLTNTDETLTVGTAEVVPFYIDDLDALQSNYKFINEFADDAAVKLGNFIDSDILAEYANATSTIDDGTLSGTAGNGITVTVGNIQNIFAAARARLGRYNVTNNKAGKVGNSGLFAVISPDFEQVLVNYLAGKNSNLGDSTGLNGHVGSYYGFDLFESNSLTWTATLAIASLPTDGDTVTLKTVDETGAVRTILFTFRSTIGVTAGNVLIDGGSSVATTITSLVTLINAPGTTTATGVALSAANQAALFRLAATAASTSVALVGKGSSFFIVSDTLTAAADGFTAATNIQHCLFGVKGATDLVIQAKPNVEIKEVPDKLGKNVLPWTLYGFKTFQTSKVRLIDVQVRVDAYTL